MEVTASRRNIAGYPVNMVIAVNSDGVEQPSAGQTMLRQQLVSLHQRFLGESLTTDDPEIDASYQLLVDTWQMRRQNRMLRLAFDWGTEGCDIPIENWWLQDLTSELADSSYMQGAWIAQLIYLMTDYR